MEIILKVIIENEGVKDCLDPKVHHYVHKSPPLNLNLSQINPVYTSYFFKIHFNIILPSTPISRQ
jgi:hypothetical protein